MRVLTLVIALVALVPAISTGKPAELLIGAVYPTGGSQGSGGMEEYRGVLLAADYANRQGVLARLISIRLQRADTSDAGPAAVENLARAGAAVVLGSYGSTVSKTAAAAASRLGVVFWETGAVGQLGMEAAGGQYVFRFAPTGGFLGRAAVAFVRDQLTPRLGAARQLRYAVAYVDDVYGRSVGLGAVAEIRSSGLPLAVVLPYDLKQVNFSDLAARIAGARADVLVVSAYLMDGVALRRAILAKRVPLLANIGTSSSYCMPEFGRLMGADAVGVFASDKPDGDILRSDALAPDAARALTWAREEYRRRYGSPMGAAALSGFAGGWALFGHVLPRAKDQSPRAIARAAVETQLPFGALPNGSGLMLAPPGHPEAGANLRATSVIWQWVRPNTRAVVWPATYATSRIVEK